MSGDEREIDTFNPGAEAKIDSVTAAGGIAGKKRTTKGIGDPGKERTDQSQAEDRTSYPELGTLNGKHPHRSMRTTEMTDSMR